MREITGFFMFNGPTAAEIKAQGKKVNKIKDFCIGTGVIDKGNNKLITMSREEIHALVGTDISQNDW